MNNLNTWNLAGLTALVCAFLSATSWQALADSVPSSTDETKSTTPGSMPSSDTGQAQTENKASSPSESKSAEAAAPAKKLEKAKADLPNFHEVHPYLYRGGEPSEAGLHKLKEMGVATIIDLRAPSEMKVAEKSITKKLGMRYINLVMDSHAPTDDQVNIMMREIDKAKKEADKKDQAVFVHCAHGSDRTGCMIGIWRVSREKWDYPTTYKEMRQYYFTPKFTKLSGAVEEYALKAHAQ